jgi:hypothetical protein
MICVEGETKLSSLLSKLRTLIQSGARGPRPRKVKPPAEPQEPSVVPEVTEAPARRRKQPEVTEAPLVETHVAEQPAERRKRLATKGARAGEDQPGALEEERVVDLLKKKQS